MKALRRQEKRTLKILPKIFKSYKVVKHALQFIDVCSILSTDNSPLIECPVCQEPDLMLNKTSDTAGLLSTDGISVVVSKNYCPKVLDKRFCNNTCESVSFKMILPIQIRQVIKL